MFILILAVGCGVLGFVAGVVCAVWFLIDHIDFSLI
jgi:hypothetical protein